MKKIFVLVNRIKINEIRWFELRNNLEIPYLCNMSAYEKYELRKEEHEIIEEVFADDCEQLLTKDNIKKTSHYKDLIKDSNDETLKQGWLEPNGKMHYCRYQKHSTYAMDALFMTDNELEHKGWIHVYLYNNELNFSSKGRITRQQAYTLKEKAGLAVDDDEIIYN